MRLRQVLLAHDRADAVGADEHVDFGLLAVRELQPHPATVLVEPRQLVAEAQRLAEPRAEHLAERLPVDRGRERLGRIRIARRVAGDLVQYAQPLVHHRRAPSRLPAHRPEELEQVRWQARAERKAGAGVEVQPVPLPVRVESLVALEHHDVDPRPP